MAKTINLGKVGLTFEGDYDSSKNYASRTCVFYNHVSWVSKKDVPAGIAPDSNDEYWQKVSERGAQGIQGERGPQGNSAFDGTGIELVNNLTQGGEASALSAEQGKILKEELTELESEVGVLSKMIYIAKEGDLAQFEFKRTNKFAFRVDTSVQTKSLLYLRKEGDDNYTAYNNYQNFATNTLHNIELDYDVTGAKVYFIPNGGSGQATVSLQMGIALAIAKNAKDIEMNATNIEANARGIEANAGDILNAQSAVKKNENFIQNLRASLLGGKEYYINREFNLQNQYVNSTNIYADLSEPKSTFNFKFTIPEDSGITEYHLYLYESDGTRHAFGPFEPNKEIYWKEHGFSVAKIAVSTVTPNNPYTGVFQFQAFGETDGKIQPLEGKVNELDNKVIELDLKINGGDLLAKKAILANNNFVNSSNLSVDLGRNVRTFNVKLSVPSDSGITKYAIYVYDLSGKNNYLDNFVPNVARTIELDYDTNKVAVAMVTPNVQYTGTFELEVDTTLEPTIITKEDFETKVDYEPRELVPSYYFDNKYLPNKVTTIRDLLENCMANGDAFFFQTDEHWEMNAQHSPALVKYIADQLNVSRLFDGGDVTHNIDAYNYPHANPDAIDFEVLRYRTFNGRVYHAMGNHEYLTWGHQEPNKWQGVNFGNWHDWMYYQRKEVADIVVADNNKHYYYVDNPQKKIRYIVLSSYKTKQEPIISGELYYTIAEFDYGQEQLRWFTEEALNVEQGWTMFVFTHNFCSFNAGAKDGEGYITNVSPYISDAVKPFAKAMLQYNGNGEIAAVFQGHLHADAIFSINDSITGLSGENATGKSIPCVATTCDAYDFDHLGDGEKLYNRKKDTITEQALDCVVVDKTNKKLTIVRIGAPAYDILTQAPNGKYPLFGDLEIREVNW